MSDLSDDLMDDDTPEFHGLSRRQLLASAAASAAGIAAIRSASPAAAQDYPLMPFKSRGRLTKRPNFLVIMIEEQRQHLKKLTKIPNQVFLNLALVVRLSQTEQLSILWGS